MIDLPTSVNTCSSATVLVSSVFQNLEVKHNDVQSLKTRAILTQTNSHPQMLNNEVSEWFPGKFSRYKSADSVSCDSVEPQKAAELRDP